MNDGMKLIVGFVSLFIAVILITVYADNINTTTNTVLVSNESLNIASARIAGGALNYSVLIPVANYVTGWRAGSDAPSECQPGNSANPTTFVLKNSTGTTVTKVTYYNVTNPGYIQVGNVYPLNASISNTTYVTYAYCNTDYQSGFSNTMMKLTVGFMALLALAIGVALLFSVYKEFKN